VLACDRTNSAVAALADSLHPAVLQMLSIVCHAGHKVGIPISVCGEIASEPIAAPLLIGLGVTELSATPPAIPLIKQAIRQCDLFRCRQVAEQMLRCTTAEEVRALLTQHFSH
jgi:phosphocarrier protein FPr